MEAFLRRQSAARRFHLRLASRVGAGALAGVLAAALTLWFDRVLGATLPVPTTNAQLLLGTLAGAMVTITVFVLWMRTVVVGLASQQASPRVLDGYLDDGFQLNMTAAMMAGFTYLTAVTAALPSHPDSGSGVPAVSAVVALLIVVSALGAVLIAMHNATSSMSMPEVVRTLADRCFAVMAGRPSADHTPPPTEHLPRRVVLRAPEMGWVQAVEHESIMRRLPAGTTLTVEVNVSDFVAQGEPLAWADAELDGDTVDAIRDGFTIVPTRTPEYDLAYAIQQLVDVAEHAMLPSSRDTSTAYEALMHLRAVFHRLLRRGTATNSLQGDDGRWIVMRRAWGTADYVRAAFRRLSSLGAQDPTTARELHETLRVLERTAQEVGDAASRDVLCEQRTALEEEARASAESRTGVRAG